MSEPMRKHILLVEDEALIALTERHVLESAGYDVTVAHTGEKALEIVTDSVAPDLVLMDMDLGSGMDGIEASTHILSICDMPIVFLSSHTEKEYTDRAERITSYGYVVKNSSNTVLLASIKMAFRLHEAHTALRNSEAELRESQEMALVGRWDYWHRQDNLQWSSTIYRIFELDETDFGASYEAFLAAIHPEDRKNVDTAWRKSLEDRQPYEIEHRLQMSDGRTKWVREYCRTVFDEAERPVHSIGIVQDITERKQIEHQLSEQTSRLNDVLENMLDLVAITDMEGVFLFAGRSHERLGYPVSSLIGRNVMEFVHPEDLAYVTEEFSKFVRSEGDRTVEYRFQCADGSYAWLETSGRILKSTRGTSTQILFNTRDVTDRKRGEDLLKNERRRLAAIIDGTNAGTWEWNVQTGETRLNERWAAIIGYTLSEIAPTTIDTWHRFTDPEDLKRSEQLLQAHMNGETEFYEVEARMQHKDGHWVWVLDRGKVTTWTTHGDPQWVLGTHQDITVRKTLEAKYFALADAASTLQACSIETIDYTEIAKTAKNLSGATVAALNLFDFKQRSFTTRAIAGVPEHIQKASKLLGFSLVGRSWDYDPHREAALGDDRTTVFPSLGSLASGNFSALIAHRIAHAFHVGEVVIIRIATTADILGDFTLLFSDENHLQNKDLVETYSSMVGNTLKRIETEEHNARLVAEKETLLREVQHRIKNNMHTMTSLLSLQATTVKDATASSAIRDAESRLRSMQVLYDQLYQSGTHQGGSLVGYLQTLVRHVVDLFSAGKVIAVSVTSRAENCKGALTLGAGRLSTVGLIVNELVTNAMKYAFLKASSATGGGRDAPKITVTIECSNGEIAISVEDNGTGLPESFDPKKPSGFGLVMINALTEQLEGTLRFESGHSSSAPGTRAELRFPWDEDG